MTARLLVRLDDESLVRQTVLSGSKRSLVRLSGRALGVGYYSLFSNT